MKSDVISLVEMLLPVIDSGVCCAIGKKIGD
jgi:hypothetical protein